MASLINEGNGRRRIEIVLDGKRPRIRLGKISERHARLILHHIEALAAARIGGFAVSSDTAAWLGQISDDLGAKLTGIGLIEMPERATLQSFLDDYIAKRSAKLKPLTLKKLSTTRDYLVAYFGSERPLHDISAGDAEEWRLHLLEGSKTASRVKRPRSENTVRKHAQVAKQFFTMAVKKRLITDNPFSGLPATVKPNHSRFRFISREEAECVLEACPDAQWRLLFALSRYGGLRCPSEHLLLRWQDILWDSNRILVRSPKTEHHEGKESRIIPLFPELKRFLDDVWDKCDPGEFVITRYRNAESNLRTQLHRIIERAGLTPWPKAFQNLRSTRQTELEESFPSHVVCAWMGNSEPVAKKHYLQVTDDHFERAATLTDASEQAAQNPAQQMCADVAQTRTGEMTAQREPLAMQGDALVCALAQIEKVAEEGLEPPTRGL